MFIVNDELLENLTCSECQKYLSVKPVKCYPNMGIRCGRCATSADAGAVSLFGVLAGRALFRCVNRFEGCNRLLGYEDVKEHERVCVGNHYNCPLCLEPFSGTAYDIYVHFKQQHKDLLLNNTPEFSIEIDNETSKTYLYRRNDLLFYITAKYTIGDEELIMNVSYLGTDQDASKITQMFELRSLDGKVQYKTKNKRCCSISEDCMQCFKVKVSQEKYPKNVVVCKVELTTKYVDSLVVLPEKYDESGKGMKDEEINNNNASVCKDANEDKENLLKSCGLKNDGGNKKDSVLKALDDGAENKSHKTVIAQSSPIQQTFVIGERSTASTSTSQLENVTGVQSPTDPFSTASNLPSVIDQVKQVVLKPERKDTVLNKLEVLEPSTSRRDQPLNKKSLLDEPIPSGSGSTVLDAKAGHYLHNPIRGPDPMVNHQPFVFCQNNPPVYLNQPSYHISNRTVNQVNNNIYIHQTQQKEIQKKTYPCTVCGRVITSQIGLWSHMRTHRPRSPSPPRVKYNNFRADAGGRTQGRGGGMFSCSECGRVISSQIGLWSHMRTHK